MYLAENFENFEYLQVNSISEQKTEQKWSREYYRVKDTVLMGKSRIFRHE